jgi:endonuclease/exonuclease/phosphatase family metal-dependent hydrolase
LKNFFIYTLLLINLIAITALGISYVSVFLSPEKFWIAALFGLAYPYLVVINLVFVVFWIIIKPRFTLFSIAAILLGYVHLSSYLQISGEKTTEKGIKVTSYNVKYFMGNTDYPNKENAGHILDFLRQNSADIICLQEVRLNKRQVFDISNTRIPNISHMQLAHSSHAGGQLTLTRYPILYMGEIRFKNSGNMIIYTDLLINTDTVRVFNCHLQSYRLQKSEINTIDSIDFNNDNLSRKKFMELQKKFKSALIKRAEQAATLHEYIVESPHPVIVCGDFNDTPVSFTYNTVKGNLLDSFTESGKGTANTYNGKLPSFRIDYILYSPTFTSSNFEVSSLNHSDHYPISCNLFPASK